MSILYHPVPTTFPRRVKMTLLGLNRLWHGVIAIQTGLVSISGVVFDDVIVAALISGIFALLNTLLLLGVTAYVTRTKKGRETLDALESSRPNPEKQMANENTDSERDK